MPASKKPSKPQLETLEHIRQYVAKHGYSPTLADLAELASVRQNCIAERLGALVKFKLITKTPSIARSIRPVEHADDSARSGGRILAPRILGE